MNMLGGMIRGDIINNKYVKGMYLTLFNLLRIGALTLDDRNPTPEDDSADIDVSISIWKFGFHFHLVKAKENICQDKSKPKSQ
jgi:hypothetical protein